MSTEATTPRPWTARIAILVAALAVAFAALVATGDDAAVGARPGTPTTFDDQAVVDPLYRWAVGFDEEDEALMLDSFTANARFDFYLAGSDDPIVFEGRDAIMDLFLGAIADQTPDEQRRHVTSNARIEWIDRRTAVVTSYLTLLVAFTPDAPPTLWGSGVYTDTVVLERDGIWRIQVRELRLDTVT